VRGDDGDVNAVEIGSDSVVVERGTGTVFVDLVSAPGDVRLRTRDGDVVVGVPAAERYRVQSLTPDGETRTAVRTDASSPHAITATSGSGDVAIRPSHPFPGPVEVLEVPDLPDEPDLPDAPDLPDLPDLPARPAPALVG